MTQILESRCDLEDDRREMKKLLKAALAALNAAPSFKVHGHGDSKKVAARIEEYLQVLE